MQSRRFATVVTLVIVVAFVVVAVAPAFATAPSATPGAAPAGLVLHARLASSTPQDGATVKSAQQVVLTFNEDVNPDFVAVRVTGPDGSETAGAPRVDGPVVTQALAAAAPAGEHTVTYRVVSADGHPVAGTVTFTTTQAPAPASPSPSPSASPSPSPSQTGSVVASPATSPTADPTSTDTGGGLTSWLVVAGVAVLAALGLGAAWRTIGGPRADADAAAEPGHEGPGPIR